MKNFYTPVTIFKSYHLLDLMIFGGNLFLFFFFLPKSDNTIRAANVVHFDLRGEYHKLIEDNLENNTVVLAIDIAKYDILISYFEGRSKSLLGWSYRDRGLCI